MISPIRKAVIPAAGFGTRFLPATKAIPKEMIPVVDKPVIQYVVEEAVAAGIEDILFVVSRGKGAIEDHFDRSPELEDALERRGKRDLLEEIRALRSGVRIHSVRQPEQRGLGDAIRYAHDHVGDEPFAVLLGDTLMRSASAPCMRQVIDVHARHGGTVIGLERVPRDRISRYGIVAGIPVDDDVLRLTDLVEKPDPADAPSDLAIAGRYVMMPSIFDWIDRTPPGKGGEIQVTDALRHQAIEETAFGVVLEGVRHDIGNPLDFLKSTVEFALERKDIGPAFRKWLRTRSARD